MRPDGHLQSNCLSNPSNVSHSAPLNFPYRQKIFHYDAMLICVTDSGMKKRHLVGLIFHYHSNPFPLIHRARQRSQNQDCVFVWRVYIFTHSLICYFNLVIQFLVIWFSSSRNTSNLGVATNVDDSMRSSSFLLLFRVERINLYILTYGTREATG